MHAVIGQSNRIGFGFTIMNYGNSGDQKFLVIPQLATQVLSKGKAQEKSPDDLYLFIKEVCYLLQPEPCSVFTQK